MNKCFVIDFNLRYTETISSLELSIEEDTKKINQLIKDLNLIENNGVCIQTLKETLKSLNVERQAYHSLSFVGNHCHKLLQVLLNFEQSNHITLTTCLNQF